MNQKHLIVHAVETDEEDFARALNITPEREQELIKIIDLCHAESATYPDACAAISLYMQNANESAYAHFYLGAFAESKRTNNELLDKLIHALPRKST